MRRLAIPTTVVEAHAISDKVEAAYRRGDLFGKRAVLMDDWAAFLGHRPAGIVPLAGKRSALTIIKAHQWNAAPA